MALIDRLLRRAPKDPYWDRFVNGPLNDPLNDASDSYRNAPPGSVFPVRTAIPEPSRMARDLAQFAVFMGASGLTASGTEAGALRPAPGAGAGPGALAEDFPYTIVMPVPAEVDPARSPGVGGQEPRRLSALVNHAVSSYIRELGYGAIVCPIEATGYRSKEKTFVGDAVLTDVPLAIGTPEV